MEINELGNVMETDVLVLGGGAAGCGAAIGAREQGARVLVIDKGVIESCGQAGAGNVNYETHLNTGPEWDTAEAITKLYSGSAGKPGMGSRAFYRAAAKQLIPMLKRLEDIGIEFHKETDGGYRRSQTFGAPGPFLTMMKNGKYVKRLLAKEVHRLGAEAVGHVMITRLLVDKGRVAGAVGFNIRNGEFYIFRAKTVVLALSYWQERVTTNSSGNPFNCWLYPHNTGSGPLLAYDAGAKITDLETLATILPKGFGAPGMASFTGMGAYMLNALGERYMERYHPRAERAPRYAVVLATHDEQTAGRGPFYIDARHLSENDLEHMINHLLYVDGNTYPEYFEQRKLDLKKHPIEVEVGELCGGGALLVNEQCRSTLSGLFGYTPSSLSFALCGGFSSGTEAAKEALKVKELPQVNSEAVAMEQERVFAPTKKAAGYTWNEFENAIRQVMNYYMGYVRNQQGMEVALDKLGLIEKQVDEIKASNYHELLRTNEAIHLVKYCQLLVRAALERKESRGFHRRSDYPNVDKEWSKKIIVLWQEGGEPKMSVEPVE